MAFALSVTPTAGTGTISVAAGSGAVTGVGTNFSGQALNGRIIIVGRVNFLVTAVASNTAMTIAPAPVQDIVGQTFTFVANGTQINQTGTDTNLSGLAAMSGVLALTIGSQTVYKLGMIKLAQPTTGASLTYNANTEGLVWHAEITAPEVITGAGRTLTVTGARTDGTYTANFYPRAMGFPRNGSEFLPSATPIDVGAGTFNATGVWFDANTTEQFTGSTNITDCKWTNTGKTCNLRLNSTAINVNGFALYGANLTLIVNPARLDGVKFFNSTYVPVTLPPTTEAAPRVHEGWDFQGALPLFNNFGGNANFTEFVNLANWDGFRVATNTVLNLAMKFTKQVSFSMKNVAGANIQNCVVYRLDTNNSNRTFYAADEHLILSTDSGGAASGKIFAQVGRLPTGYVANSTVYTATMDFRNAANNGTGNDEVFFASYDHLLSSRAINTKGNGILAVEQTLFADPSVTLSRTAAIAKLASSFTVNPTTQVVTVTANSSYDDLYDVLKAYKCTANATNVAAPVRGTQMIVTPSGTSLNAFANWTLVVNNGITLASGVKFDAISFTTVTLTGTGQITGIYTSSAGASVTLRLQSVTATAVAAVWNPSTNATELFQTNNTGSTTFYEVYYPPGSVGLVKNYARELYGSQRSAGSITLAAGLNTISFVDVQDVGITQTTLATVNAYTAIETASKFYDRTAAFRLTEQGIKLGQIATRSGTAIEIGTFNHVINQAAAAVYAILSGTITTKSTAYAGDSKYITEIATPPATITAATTEVITIAREDANGDSQITIQAAGVSTFEIWKITNATNPDNYATGTLVATVGIGTWRFLSAPGFKFVIRDQTTNYRVVNTADKGIYTAELFFGAQVQLAQAATVDVINTKVDVLTVNLAAVPAAVLAAEVEPTIDMAESLRLYNAVLGGKVSGAGSGVETFRDINDTKDRVVADVDSSGNRTSITRNLT